MNACDLIRRLHQHRSWVNSKLLLVAFELTPEQLKQPLAIGQGSLWKTLLHLHAAEYVWLESLLGNETPLLPGDAPGKLPGNQQAGGGIESLAHLSQAWQALDERWNAYLANLTEPALNDWVYKTSTSANAGQRNRARRSDVLLHVCTHAQYTTAQAVNMLRQLGATALPDVMLISLARQEAAAEAD